MLHKVLRYSESNHILLTDARVSNLICGNTASCSRSNLVWCGCSISASEHVNLRTTHWRGIEAWT